MSLPLSEQLRPRLFSEVGGQEHLIGPKGYITRIVEGGRPLSILLFGPPGTGKTTIARLYAEAFSLPFVSVSAVLNSTAELKKIIKEGAERPLFHRQTLVFVDEIHRFNRSQQDLFLPLIEDGSLILIGATTENPSFAINGALLSRLRVLNLRPLDPPSLRFILDRYEKKRNGSVFNEEVRQYLIDLSQGDGRHLVNLLENLETYSPDHWDLSSLSEFLQRKPPLYDKNREGHYNLISALHKSIRGSDPDAALYWFCRMVQGGEDLLYIGRRLIRAALEDIGLADSGALQIASEGYRAYQMLGSPEGDLAMAQVVVYLALAPKSCAVYTAYNEAKEGAHQTGSLNPPYEILNAPTELMKEMGYGKGYQYDHDLEEGFSGQNYFPPEFKSRPVYYRPLKRGFEREMVKRLEYFSKLRSLKNSNNK